jgi:hypothetical protein
VQFIVNTDSTISDVQAISGPKKGGLREESVRVITLSDNVRSTARRPTTRRNSSGKHSCTAGFYWREALSPASE